MDLREFLGYFDFDYDIVSPGGKYEDRIRQERIEEGDICPEDADKDLICLIDLQGAYLGDIGQERYPIEQASISKIVDRMDVYIHDMLIVDFEEALGEYGADLNDMDLEQMVHKSKELGLQQGQVSYILADAVLNPDSITLAELRSPVSLDEKIQCAAKVSAEQKNIINHGAERSSDFPGPAVRL